MEAAEGVAVTLVIAAALFLALRRLVLCPLRDISHAVASLRADPEHVPPRLPAAAPEEIALAMADLRDLRQDIRRGTWRRARLAAAGASASRFSHDIRGLLAPAMLSAERLQSNVDAPVRRHGDIVLRSVERTIELVRSELEFARGGAAPFEIRRLVLHDVVATAAKRIAAHVPRLDVRNLVDPELAVEADVAELERVLVNLLRNAGEAGATLVTVEASGAGMIRVLLTDDGPGLPASVASAPFQPPEAGRTGIGLALARDLMRAHRGELELVATSHEGTTLCLVLPLPREMRVPARPAETAASLPQGNPRAP